MCRVTAEGVEATQTRLVRRDVSERSPGVEEVCLSQTRARRLRDRRPLGVAWGTSPRRALTEHPAPTGRARITLL